MKFTNFKTIKLATAPGTGDNPPSGCVYEWHTLDESNNLVINYRLSDGTDKTFTPGSTYSLPTASDSVLGGVKVGSGLSITNGVLSASGGGGSSSTIATITSSGNWTVPSGVSLLKDVWIFGGGGGGSKEHGAGGGAGGLLHLSNYAVTPGASIACVVGAGGVGHIDDRGANGGDSSFAGWLAYGGGGAGGGDPSEGGCGGGGSFQFSPTGGNGQQGFRGGAFISNDMYGGGGGGGVSSGGRACLSSGQRADGGLGIDLSYYVGTSVGDSGWFGGGGGGGTYNAADNTRYGRGGKGGGGDGGHYDTLSGHNGLANTGGGGGGSSYSGGQVAAGNGGSGIIIIRY